MPCSWKSQGSCLSNFVNIFSRAGLPGAWNGIQNYLEDIKPLIFAAYEIIKEPKLKKSNSIIFLLRGRGDPEGIGVELDKKS